LRAKFVNESGIPYKAIPGKSPVIGKIITKPMEFAGTKFGPAEYEVIEKSGDIYICNQWYKPGVPQVVHQEMVDQYIEYNQDDIEESGVTGMHL
jgi:hypothetical protein